MDNNNPNRNWGYIPPLQQKTIKFSFLGAEKRQVQVNTFIMKVDTNYKIKLIMQLVFSLFIIYMLNPLFIKLVNIFVCKKHFIF